MTNTADIADTGITPVQPRTVPGGWSLRGQIRGYKGGKGGGSSRTPVEAKDSLHSTSYARVLDLVSEGEIEGLVSGLQSIYLDGTPLQNADGRLNFEGVTADFRSGTPLQAPVAGFPDSESTTSVGVELTSATPWVRAIGNTALSAVRVMLGVNGLSKANTKNGDINGHKVNYAIDLQTDGGAWQQVLQAAFSGKTTQQYRRTHRIDLPEAATGWSLRVRRLTPNANSSTTADTTVIDSITEVIDGKLRYPMSALVGLQVDASQFRSIPQRAYHLRGRIIRVPSNYNAQTRTYAGVWDGTFKTAYSNNPAWVFYDLVTNDRYGLGQRIPQGWINKWSLYQIAAYCDELVPDGQGGQEPRFTCNVCLQTRQDATRVLQDLCSIFRGMVYWGAGAAVPVADMPRDPVYTYTQANVIEGRFTYSGSRGKDRHSVALVSYNDLGDMGRQKVLYVQDDAAVARYGIRQIEISAFGCTSAAQARRVGQWALLTAQRESRAVAFSVGLDGALCAPGKVIRVADSLLAGRRIGGRIRSATASTLVLDSTATVKVGDTLTATLPSGQSQTRRVQSTSVQNAVQRVTISPAFDAAPPAQSVWTVESAELAAQLYTVVSVTEGEGLTFDIAAVQHEPGKFAHIDRAQPLPERPITVLPAQVLPTPTGITVQGVTSLATDGAATTTVTIAWGRVKGASSYDVQWSRSQSDWVQVPRSAATSVDITNAYSGDYIARVRAISPTGTHSDWAYSEAATITGQTRPPANYDSFTVLELDGGLRRYSFGYQNAQPPADLAGAQIRCIAGTPEHLEWQAMAPLGEGSGYYTSSFDSAAPEAGLWTFALRAVNRSGVLSDGMLVVTAQLFEGLYVADLTPPPAPTGVQVTSALSSVIVQWDSPSYTEGHGHQATRIYAAQASAQQPNPPRSSAQLMAQISGPVGDFAARLGSTWQVWVTNLSNDGVESSAAGPFDVRLGMVGGHDLADDLDLAAKLADGSITATKLAEKIIDATKFAQGIEPVSIVASGPLPTAKTTSAIVYGGKLYRWDGSKYTAETAAADVAGQLTDAQLAAISAAKLTGQITGTQITDKAISTAKLAAGAVTANEIAANAVTAVKIAANAVEAGKIAANAVTADKIAANSITSAKIATGAVTATEIAANAITASKIALTDTTNLIADQDMLDSAAWSIGAGWAIAPTTLEAFASANIGQFAYNAAATGTSANLYCKQFSVEPGSEYYFEAQGRMTAAAVSGAILLRVYWYNGMGAVLSTSPHVVGTLALNGTAVVTLGKKMVAPAGAKRALFAMAVVHGSTTGTVEAGGQVVRRMASAELIVDGAITATKLAANSIAVGTAAIQAGAIVNAHIGNLSADKITAGTLAAARIAAGSIDAGKLAADAVTADKIAANSVTTAKIAASAIDASKIAANAVTAAKIDVSNLSAIAANLGTVTAGRIQNAANTSYWNLGATGATTMLKLGNDLTYDETNGLKINKLNVIGTAQIANGALSNGTAIYADTPATYNTYDAWFTVLSGSFTTTAGRVLISPVIAIGASGSYTSAYNADVEVRILRNGTAVRKVTLDMEMYEETYGGESPTTMKRSRLPFSSHALVPILDNPPSGTNTYEMQVRILRAGTSVSLKVADRGMSLVEFKR